MGLRAQLRTQANELRNKDFDMLRLEAKALARGRRDTVFFAEFWLGMKLNPFQKRLFTEIDKKINAGEFAQIICPTANQVGKSVGDAIIHIKFNFFKIGMELQSDTFLPTFYQTLNLSPVLRQSKITMQYVEQILTSTFTWPEDGKTKTNKCRVKNFLKGKNENMGRLEFSNNSLAYFISTGEDQGANIQGAQFGAITYDECSLSGHLQEELPSKILSRLAKYGNLLVLISSPKSESRNNSQQYFYHLVMDAKRGTNDFVLINGVFDENVFIPEKQREKIKAQLKSMDENAYREVVFGEFVSSPDAMFPAHVIQEIWNGKTTYSEPRDGRDYVIVVDWGLAEQGDKTVFAVFDYTEHPNTYELVYGYTEKGGDPWGLMAKLIVLKKDYNDAKIIMDANSLGGLAMRKLLRDISPIPFTSAGEGKLKALVALKVLLTEPSKYGITNIGKIKSYYITALEGELASYKMDDKKIEQDWVMVMSMAAYFFKKYLTSGNKKAKISIMGRFNSLRHGN